MKIETKIIRAALDNIRHVIGRRTLLPILSCVKLHTEGNRLHIAASNLDEHIVEQIEASGQIDPTCVSFEFLYNALSGDEAEIKLVKSQMVITCGSAVTKLSIVDAGEFPQTPEMKKAKNHGAPCAELAKAIEQVKWAASDDAARYVINSVLVTSTAKKLTAVAINGRELAVSESAVIGTDFSVVMPSAFCGNISAALSREGAMIATDENQIRISHDAGVYSCRQIEGVYPNWRQVIPAKMETLGTVSVEEMKALLEPTVRFSSHSEAPAKFTFSKSGLLLELVGDNASNVSRTLAGKFAEFEVSLSTKKMLKIFQSFKDDNATISFVDNLSPIKIGAGDYFVITTPMRMS